MKKLILMTAAAMFVLVSCQKEEIQVEKPEVSLFDKGNTYLKVFEWDGNINSEPKCVAPNGSCIPEVIIRGKIANAFDVISTGDITAIEAFFKENKTDLTTSINVHAVEGVIDGSLNVTVAGPNSKDEIFMIFKNHAGINKLVIPFVK